MVKRYLLVIFFVLLLATPGRAQISYPPPSISYGGAYDTCFETSITPPLTGSVSGGQCSISIPDASTSQKGAASFNTNNFSASSGAISIKADGVTATEIAADAVGTSEIATDGVGSAEIAAGAVGTAEIANGTVADADIDASGITTRSKLPSAICYEDEANTYGATAQDFGAAQVELPNATSCSSANCDAAAEVGRVCIDNDLSTDGQSFLYCSFLGGSSYGWRIPSLRISVGTVSPGDRAEKIELATGDFTSSASNGVVTISAGSNLLRITDPIATGNMPATWMLNNVKKYFGTTQQVSLEYDSTNTDLEFDGQEVAILTGLKLPTTPLDESYGGTGANNTATTGRYLRGNGTAFATSSVAAAGAGACTAGTVANNLQDNTTPGCVDIDSTYASAAMKTHQACFTIFNETSALNAATLDLPSIWMNKARAITVTSVCCEISSEASAAATINLQRDDGTPADIVDMSGGATDLVCSTSTGGACATVGAGDIVGAEDNVAVGDEIDLDYVSGANAKRINICFTYTVDAD